MTVKAALVACLLVCIGCGPGDRGDTADAPPGGDDTPDADRGCVTAEYAAQQTPLALLVVLDRSSSMIENNKWAFAAQAVVAALDQDVFDSVSVGLYVAPSGTVAGPSCIFGFPVACEAPAFPQIDLTLAGTEKSSAATGVRRQIKDWLTTHSPDGGAGDASPMYNAIQASIGALSLWPTTGKRAMLVVTDGTLSCTQFSSRAGYPDCNGCDHDWENPQNIVDLLAAANADPTTPVDTFLVGVPGADTFDSTACMYPPYHMRLALSAIAAAGAPDYISPTCDGRTFTEAGGDPTESCHFDMTQPGSFSAGALADAISTVRGQTLGCTFDLPMPPDGSQIDLGYVNVSYTVDGIHMDLARRADPTNQCTTQGCWDYTPGNTQIELIGQACADIAQASSVQVSITTGCVTVVL
jgi:hypothetical protein